MHSNDELWLATGRINYANVVVHVVVHVVPHVVLHCIACCTAA